MTSQRKDKLVIAEHGVLTEEALLAYLADELAPEQRVEVERLLKDDPFAQDALEGLRTTHDKQTLKVSISAVNKKVRERSGKRDAKTIKLHWSTYAYAAGLVGLLITVGFILTMYTGKDNGQVAQDTHPTGQVATETQAETQVQAPVAIQDTSKAASDSVSVSPSHNGTFANGTGSTGNVAGNGLASHNDAANDVAVAKPAGTASGYTPTTPDNKVGYNNSTLTADGTGSTTVTSRAASEAKNAAVKENEVKAVSMEDAMKTFNSGDYKTAAGQFDAVLKEQPDNSEALFFGGVSDYVQNDLKKSEKNFDKLLNKGTKYVDGSKWYKANILLKKGKKEDAKKLLEQLSMSKGSYTERAKKKLAEGGF